MGVFDKLVTPHKISGNCCGNCSTRISNKLYPKRYAAPQTVRPDMGK